MPGPQMAKLTDSYLSTALIPALNRLGIAPVGAFKLDIGPETPAAYLLLPSTSPDLLANVSVSLSKDAAYVKAAEPFHSVTAVHRIDSALLAAFDDFAPAVPPSGKRIFQLRIYESPQHAGARQQSRYVPAGRNPALSQRRLSSDLLRPKT